MSSERPGGRGPIAIIDASNKQRLQAVVDKAQQHVFQSPALTLFVDMCQHADDLLYKRSCGTKTTFPTAL